MVDAPGGVQTWDSYGDLSRLCYLGRRSPVYAMAVPITLVVCSVGLLEEYVLPVRSMEQVPGSPIGKSEYLYLFYQFLHQFKFYNLKTFSKR